MSTLVAVLRADGAVQFANAALEDMLGLSRRTLEGVDFSSFFIMLASPPADYKGAMTYDALTKAGVPLFAYGNFITVAINFVILAFIIFMMVKQINRLKKDTPPAPPAAPAEDVLLLREIRDSLKK